MNTKMFLPKKLLNEKSKIIVTKLFNTKINIRTDGCLYDYTSLNTCWKKVIKCMFHNNKTHFNTHVQSP